MISMSTINSIRQMRREGDSIVNIARNTGVCRDTVYKYLAKDDFSPKMPVDFEPRPSKLDPYKNLINQWIDEDEHEWRKQRHTARRIWQRLIFEEGLDVSETTVSRYVRTIKDARKGTKEQYLDLQWAPSEAQADFGEADFYIRGTRMRLSYFVLSFPFSNVGFAQVFPGENAECVCEALKRIFEHIGGVPRRIVFDNATGIGRRVCKEVHTTKMFGAFAAHYGFGFSFCNPNAGHEKGNVENKVGALRRSLFVPVPYVTDMAAFNKRLLECCMEHSMKTHWLKAEPENQLFMEDRLASYGLPEKPFAIVRYERPKTNKQGKVAINGPHHYSTSPRYAECEVIAAIGALKIEIYDTAGTFICKHIRAYGNAPTDTSDPASQLPLLCTRAKAWRNSQVRAALSEDLRAHMDALTEPDLRAELRMMRDESAKTGWAATKQAVEMAFAATGRLDEASVSIGAARIASGNIHIDYDEPVNLAEYDHALQLRA